MSISNQTGRSEIDQIIASEFGVNANYVADLFQQFEQNPQSVDEEWREFFNELLGGARDGGRSAPPPVQTIAAPREQPQPTAPATILGEPHLGEQQLPSTRVEKVQLKGSALRIAQNMEASLAVPTATSTRQVATRLLEENRLLINGHLARAGQKVSYTHLVSRAIVKALGSFPQLNDAYDSMDGSFYRVPRKSVNLGIAVDVTRKDGSRTLLVPNIKNAGGLTFTAHVAAYDDTVARAREGKLQVVDFQDTTMSLTNPGTLGTTSSNPRLMPGQ